jgi:hypothetical protein
VRRRVCSAMLSPAERERNIFRLAWSRPGSLSNPRRETLTPPTNSSASTRNSSDTRSTVRDHRTPGPIATEHPTRCSQSSRASDRPEICRADQSEAQQKTPTQDQGQHISERNIGTQKAGRHPDARDSRGSAPVDQGTPRPPRGPAIPHPPRNTAQPRHGRAPSRQARRRGGRRVSITRRQTSHPAHAASHQRDAAPGRQHRHRHDRAVAGTREHQDHPYLRARRPQAQRTSSRAGSPRSASSPADTAPQTRF